MCQITMARSQVSVLQAAAILLLLLLLLLLTLASPSAISGQPGFQSINCGGEGYKDPNTKLVWEEDPFNKNNNVLIHGRVGKVNSSFANITNVMKTLRFFPDYQRNTKFCYSLQVSNGTTYLLRASFFYGNYDNRNEPPTFVLIFNYDVWTKVVTTSTTSIMYELTFSSKEHDIDICLAPDLDSNHTPFISTLELRNLSSEMYASSEGGGLYYNYGLRLWRRINYGATTKAAIRYPDDPYDRIWEANTTGPIASTSANKLEGAIYTADPDEPPAEVMATAITSTPSKDGGGGGNLSLTYDGFGGTSGYRVVMHFQDPFENASSAGAALPVLGLAFPNSDAFTRLFQNETIYPAPDSPTGALLLDNTADLPTPLQITLFARDGSPRGPLLNAVELFHWTLQPLSTGITFQGDVDAIKIVRDHFNLTGYGQGDPCVPTGYKWTWIACNDDAPPRITEINLASFNLTGEIPQSINNIQNLESIDLSNNMLIGQIPNVSLLLSLKYLDVHNNHLNGSLPPSLHSLPELAKLDVSNNSLCGIPPSFESSVNFSYIGNLRLCTSGSQCKCNSGLSSSSTIEKTDGSTRKYIFAISFLGALVSVLVLLIIYKSRQGKTKVQNSMATTRKGGDDLECLPFVTKKFTYNEIMNATLGFTTILGEGGFGKVYHGLLPSGEAIAVKMLADASKQGLKEFYNEVAILSRVRHKNLVSLIGYCVENTYMLIYEYIAKGNLRDLIYGDVESTDKPLPWTTRLHIALDASQGLEYLHTGCDPTIIHRDVKSSNILLSDKMQAKVSDFGLSRFKEGDPTISHVSTLHVVGTAGYLDPAYNTTNQLTNKSDVYSFGIVLFELICGRAPIDMFTSPPHIVEWVTPAIMEGKVGEIVDPMLANGYKMESMWKVVDLAFGCVESDRMKRPKMSQVVQLLQNVLEFEMDQVLPPQLQDVSGGSSTSDGKIPTSLQYIGSLQINLEPR